jgi:tRNA(Ile)-lysidine synthase
MARPIPTTLQELPPRWARLALDVEAFAARLLRGTYSRPNGGQAEEDSPLRGKGLVLACSGGADSIALLHLLVCLKARAGFRLVAAHLDHALRNASSEDARFVSARCADLRVPYVAERADVRALARERGMGLEEAGRETRYAFLERVRADYGADWIVTGHQLDDLTEDVLMRLMRGTGWPGLSGMPALDRERGLLRPLLLTRKAKLAAFLEDLSLTWREDASNALNDHMRNRVRNKLLPLIAEENAGFPSAVARLWTQGALDAEYWEHAVDSAHVIRTERGPELRRVELREMHPALRLRLYKKLLDELGPGQVRARTLFEMDAAVVREESPRPQLYQFPGGKAVHFKGGRLMFRYEDDLGPEPVDPTSL